MMDTKYREEFDQILNELRGLYKERGDYARIYVRQLMIEGILTQMMLDDVPINTICDYELEYRGVVGNAWP